MLKNVFKKHPLQNRTNVQIKGGGGQRPFEQCSNKLHFFERGASLTAVPELLCCSASFSLLITLTHDAVGIYCGSTSTKSGYHPQMWFSSTKSDLEPTLTAATANKGCGYERNIKRLDNGGILTSLGTFQKIVMQGAGRAKSLLKNLLVHKEASEDGMQ